MNDDLEEYDNPEEYHDPEEYDDPEDHTDICLTDIYKNLVENALKNAENGVSKITDHIIQMEGMTGTKTRHFYNNLLDTPDARYLEIGSWKGSSVCSAMCNNKATVVCIDNWSEFGGPKDEFLSNFSHYKGNNQASFIESDSFALDVSTLPKFNIYMYDGNHDEKSHYNALVHYYNCLDDTFIFVVDDWDWEHVRKGTMDSIKSLKFSVLYEKHIITSVTPNMIPNSGGGRQDWWNGMYVAILQKDTAIE
jgi:hypothetical protein